MMAARRFSEIPVSERMLRRLATALRDARAANRELDVMGPRRGLSPKQRAGVERSIQRLGAQLDELEVELAARGGA
jgi:hypothetical protein